MDKILSFKNNSNDFFMGLIFILLIIWLKYLWDRRWLYYYAFKLPGPPSLPIIGNALYFQGGTENILETTTILFNRYGTQVKFWFGNRLFFFVSSPKNLGIILNKTLHKEKLYNFTKSVAGEGLFSAPVNKWKKNRRLIQSTFNQKILNSFVKIFCEKTKILNGKLEKYADGRIFDVHNMMHQCTFDIICETVVGQNINAQIDNHEFGKWVRRSSEIVYIRMFQIWYYIDFIWNFSSLSKELKILSRKIREFCKEILIYKKKQYLDEKSIDGISNRRKVLLDYLIEISEESGKLTDDEIVDEITTFLIGGSDTTGSINSFCLIMLGMYPDIQQKVYKEIFDVLGEDKQKDLTYEDLPKLFYLERVIKETMRLFPAGPLIVRAIEEDIKTDTFVFPKGSSCVLGILHNHRNPDHWPDPLQFDPDRFCPEEIVKRHPYAWIPFSAGPRNCIGIKYAMMTIKTVVGMIVREFEIGTNYKSVNDIRIKADLIIKTVYGYNINLRKRSSIH